MQGKNGIKQKPLLEEEVKECHESNPYIWEGKHGMEQNPILKCKGRTASNKSLFWKRKKKEEKKKKTPSRVIVNC